MLLYMNLEGPWGSPVAEALPRQGAPPAGPEAAVQTPGSSKRGTSRKCHSCYFPKGPYTAHLRTLVPKTIPGIVFGTSVLKWAVYGPFGFVWVCIDEHIAIDVDIDMDT